MKYKSIIFILYIIILFGCNNSGEKSFYIIRTTVRGAKITGLDQEYFTPAKIKKEGFFSKKVEISQQGFHSKTIALNPLTKENNIFVELEPLIKEVIIETEPDDAIIKYDEDEYSSGDTIKLNYNASLVFALSRRGYLDQKRVLRIEELKDSYKFDLEIDPETYEAVQFEEEVKLFEEELRKAIGDRDDQLAASLLEPYREGVFQWVKAEPYLDKNGFLRVGNTPLSNLKYYAVNNIGWDYSNKEEWGNLKYLLSFGIPGFCDSDNPYIGRASYLYKAIVTDKPKVIRELVEAGAKIDASAGSLGSVSDIRLAVENQSYQALEELLKLGADPNRPSGKRPKIDGLYMINYPIFSAVRQNDKKAIKLLLENGALTTLQEEKGEPGVNEKGEAIITKTIIKLVDNNGKFQIFEEDPIEIPIEEAYKNLPF